MDFSIVPYVKNAPLKPEEITVQVPPEFEEYANNLLLETQKITTISNKADQERVIGAQSRVQAVLRQIETAREAAQSPITALKNAIQDAAKNVTYALDQEKLRFSNLLRAAADAEKARRDAAIREAHEAHRRETEARQAEILKLQNEKQRLMIEARAAEDLATAAENRRKAAELEEQTRDAQFDLDMQRESQVIEPQFSAPLVPGARTSEAIEFEIADEELFFRAISADILSDKPKGLIKIAKVDLRLQAAKDLVKELRKKNKGNPKFDVVSAFEEIGIKVTISLRPQSHQAVQITRELR